MLGVEKRRGTGAGLGGRRRPATEDPAQTSRLAASRGWLLRRGRGKGVGRRAGSQWEGEPGWGGTPGGSRPTLGGVGEERRGRGAGRLEANGGVDRDRGGAPGCSRPMGVEVDARAGRWKARGQWEHELRQGRGAKQRKGQ